MTPPLNLASRPFQNEALPGLLFAGASVVLLALTLEHGLALKRLLSTSTSSRHKEAAVLEEEASRLRRTVGQRPPQPPKEAVAHWALLKELVDRRTLSWTGLLADLEEVLPPGVRLVAIAPNVKAGVMHLELGAVSRSLDEGLAFVRALQDRRGFADVYPLGVHTRDDGGVDIHYGMTYLPDEAANARSAKPATGKPKPGNPAEPPEEMAPEEIGEPGAAEPEGEAP